VFESLTEFVSGSSWSYVYLLVVSALDVIVPVVPSESSVILGGVFAGSGDLLLWLVILSSGTGAVLGDNIAYWIGRKAEGPIVRRFFSGERAHRLEWAREHLATRGPYLIVVGRFIPGGRTAVTVTAGILEMPYGRFLTADVVAGALWASYAALLGYVGGSAFEEEPWKGFLAAFAVALAVTGVIELVRWARRRRAAARASA
jgi:membrane protein DedA with SNARE-associated domain